MRILIDGYNLMYAAGLMPPRGRLLSPAQFRKLRTRLLDRIAEGLPEVDAHQTVVVFDASVKPPDDPALSREETHRGIRARYAQEAHSADDALEDLIHDHPTPRTLTVVSSDNRIRLAAKHRKCVVLRSDEFLDRLDAYRAEEDRRARRSRLGIPATIVPPNKKGPLSPEEEARLYGLDERETGFWLREFSELAHDPQTRAALNPEPEGLISEEDIDRIAREIEIEFDRHMQGTSDPRRAGRRPPRPRSGQC